MNIKIGCANCGHIVFTSGRDPKWVLSILTTWIKNHTKCERKSDALDKIGRGSKFLKRIRKNMICSGVDRRRSMCRECPAGKPHEQDSFGFCTTRKMCRVVGRKVNCVPVK